MGIAVAVLSGFILGFAAPGVHRLARGATGWLLALLPAGLCFYFGSFLADLPVGGVAVGLPWVPSLGLNLTFLVDGLSALFALLISGVGAIVLVYSSGYLAGDVRLGRLYSLLLLFMASMLGLVLADNLLTMFVFWELTSLTSYLLIGFDHHRAAARAAALQALLVTGGGGLAMLVGLLLLGQVGIAAGLPVERCFEFTHLVSLGRVEQSHVLYAPILVLILMGAFTKSAQFPFSFWLPSAMEAPTPISAYLHSATMVKAGVYLLARFSPLLGGTPMWQWSVTTVGAITMLSGAVLATQESDMKRILAHSTVSALGMMVLLLGLGTPAAVAAAMAFVLAHAMYKGALFLVAGAVDHGTGTRDVNQLSGLARSMPVTAVAAVLAAISFAAVPPAFGFIAKELVLEAVLQAPWQALVTTAIVLTSMLFVALAMVLGIRPYFGRPSDRALNAHEGSLSLCLGPLLMAVLGIALAIWPHWIDSPLLAAAGAAVLQIGEITPLKLALWHGWNMPLAISGISLVGGLVLYGVRHHLRLPAGVLDWGPARLYRGLLVALNFVAHWQTKILQGGYLRYYLIIILLTLVGFVASAIYVHGVWRPSLHWTEVRFYEAAIVSLVLLAVAATVTFRSMLSAIAALGCVGYGIALLFVFYGAPDLAATQFLIETLTVILFVLVFYHLSPDISIAPPASHFRDGVIALLIGGMMTTLVLLAVDSEHMPSVSSYYAEHSLTEAHGRNVVNVILVDFRALDTLGEISVLAAAALGVHSLLKLRIQEGTDS